MNDIFGRKSRWNMQSTTKIPMKHLIIAASCLLIILVIAAFVFPGFGFPEKTDSADQWKADTIATRPISSCPSPDTNTMGVSPLFEQYYQNHGAEKNFGKPVTVAFPTQEGWLQFFEANALLLPSTHRTTAQESQDSLTTLVNSGIKDASTGIIRLPLIQALLTLNSLVPIGGQQSTINYVDLRKATDPALMPLAPAQSNISADQGVFIKGGTRSGKDVGHFIPQLFWNFITSSTSSQEDWKVIFGTPLTEAQSFTVTENGTTHHMLVQAFSYDGLLLDQDTLDDSNQPVVQRLDTGVDYLCAAGLPKVAISVKQMVWSLGNINLLNTPGTNNVIIHVGQNVPLTLLGDTQWRTGILWYHVKWAGAGSGWVSATDVTFTSPGNVPTWASFDELSANLAAYLTKAGSNVSASVYDITRSHYYTYNIKNTFIAGSSMKVPIMLTFLDMVEQQGRTPDSHEIALLTTMIENSDNDAASELYYNEIGGAGGVSNFLQKIGITDIQPNSGAWGYTQITSLAMVNLLTLLYQGKILTARDRQFALNLMENVETDQQIGVGDTAPPGATVAMKNGWLPGPDDLWSVNTSGIVMFNNKAYIIAVYTQEQQSQDDGNAIGRQICGQVATALAR